MALRWTAPGRRTVGAGVLGALVLVGCNLGVDPVTHELVDSDGSNDRLGPSGLDTGDVDGDGDEDVVVAGRDGYGVLTNDGAGAYTLDIPPDFSPGEAAPSLVDVDGDDDLDLVSRVTEWVAGPIPILRRNDGGGNFGAIEAAGPSTPPGSVTTLVATDADGDGDADILAAVRVGNDRQVATYRNDGTGAFAAPTLSSLGFTSDAATPTNLVAGDLDDDGDDDVVATDVAPITRPGGTDIIDGTVAVVGLNDGTGSFTAAGPPIEATYSAGGSRGLSPALADLDEDGHLDLALGGPGSVATLLGDGAGGLGTPRLSEVPDTRGIDLIATADVDGDGHVDIVGFDDPQDYGTGVVVYGDGTGGVDAVHELGTGTDLGDDGTGRRQTAVTDLEGDGDPDILFLAGSLGVVENAVDGRPAH